MDVRREYYHHFLENMRKKYDHLNLFSEYDKELHAQALFNGWLESVRFGPDRSNLQPRARDYGLRVTFNPEDLIDEYHISLVKHAIAKHNKEVVECARLGFEELLFVDMCNSLSHLEYHFFFVARKLSNRDLGGYYTEVHAAVSVPDELIHVESFCCLRNGDVDGSLSLNKEDEIKIPSSDESGCSSDESGGDWSWNVNEDGSESVCEEGKQSNESSIGISTYRNANVDVSGSSCEKGKQLHESSMGINSYSTGILSDRILTPVPIMGLSEDIGGTTVTDCEIQLKFRRRKYEHLNLFSKYHMKLHIKALYNGYQAAKINSVPGGFGLRISFRLEDLDDEYHENLVKYAIVIHNRKEDVDKLSFEELLFIDTGDYPSYYEYHYFFVASTISACHPKGDLGGYYAKVKDTKTPEKIRVQYFCRLRNTNEGKSSMGINSDSIGSVSHRIQAPTQMEDPEKTMDKKKKKTMEDYVKLYKEMQAEYENLHMFTTSEKKENVIYLMKGYELRKIIKSSLKKRKRYDYPFQTCGVNLAFTMDDLKDEYHNILVKYAIAKHNKKEEDKLELKQLISVSTYTSSRSCGVFREYRFCFVARNNSNDKLGGYCVHVSSIIPDAVHEDIHAKGISCLGNANEDGIHLRKGNN